MDRVYLNSFMSKAAILKEFTKQADVTTNNGFWQNVK
jgi:hypothetical protein